jgi:predicted metal-dependent hydrolase
MSSKRSAMTSRHAKQLHVGSQTVAYTLTRANRKSIGITIHPDLRVEVRAPRAMGEQAIEDALQQRARWILRHLAKFAQRPAKARPAIQPHAGVYLWLGEYKPLQVIPLENDELPREGVTVDADKITVSCKAAAKDARVAKLLEQWSRGQAAAHFAARIATVLPHFATYNFAAPALKVRKMRARWGSCSTNGIVTLNVKLIHLDPVLIDYVIMHELCHLVEHNHSKRYYALLTHMMPDWAARRQRLNETGMPE